MFFTTPLLVESCFCFVRVDTAGISLQDIASRRCAESAVEANLTTGHTGVVSSFTVDLLMSGVGLGTMLCEGGR